MFGSSYDVSQKNKSALRAQPFITFIKVAFHTSRFFKTDNQDPETDAAELEKKLYLWATSRCSQKEYCRSELAQKMRQKGASSALTEQLLQRLESERYVDETRYARAFVSDKFRFESWGKMKIRYTLQQKGLSNNDIEEGLSAISEEDYKNSLKVFLNHKLKTTKGETAYDIKSKAARSAITRGFEPQLVFAQLSLEEMD